jgi:hypothetical protein
MRSFLFFVGEKASQISVLRTRHKLCLRCDVLDFLEKPIWPSKIAGDDPRDMLSRYFDLAAVERPKKKKPQGIFAPTKKSASTKDKNDVAVARMIPTQ